jgi:hypothetical protein
MTILLYFVPFLYMFGAGMRLRLSYLPAAAGALTTLAVLILALFPPADAARPSVYFVKLIGGAGLFFALGIVLYWRGSARSVKSAD